MSRCSSAASPAGTVSEDWSTIPTDEKDSSASVSATHADSTLCGSAPAPAPFQKSKKQYLLRTGGREECFPFPAHKALWYASAT
jgi:hypothetical protein